ncbi:hypothetical protein GOODEAATRI_020215 [Goodea atripinnis]|uniref:Secreted protein n=1 Tax=Goodea atripinnis TaxID=208336 RepID=A0ABV0PFI4_9TELE
MFHGTWHLPDMCSSVMMHTVLLFSLLSVSWRQKTNAFWWTSVVSVTGCQWIASNLFTYSQFQAKFFPLWCPQYPSNRLGRSSTS